MNPQQKKPAAVAGPPTYFAYLRVSRDSQDVNNQRLWLLDYANAKGYSPLTIVTETASRSVPWRDRQIGKLLLDLCKPGDFILTSEFTRLGGSPSQVFSIMETAASKGVSVVITKNQLVLDNSMNSQIMAVAFSLASMIEVEFTRARTREGLERARLEGRVGGRKKGSTGRLKLDKHKDRIAELIALELSVPKMAKHFEVAEKTMRKFVNRNFPKT